LLLLHSLEVAAPAPRAEPAQKLPGDGDGFEPTVAADGDGRVVVAAIQRRLGISTPTSTRHRHRIITWHSADGGTTWSPPQQVQPRPDDCGAQNDPWLQTDGRGRFYLAYLAAGPFPADPKKDAEVSAVVQPSADGGKTWQAPHEAWKGALLEPDKTVLARSPDGRRLVLAWLSRGGALSGLQHLQQSTDDGKTWAMLPSPPIAQGARPGHPSGLVVTDRGTLALGCVTVLGTRTHQVVVAADGGKTWAVHRWEPAGPGQPTGSVALALDGAQTFHAVSVRAAAAGAPAGVLHRHSADGLTWSGPSLMTEAEAGVDLQFPVLAAADTRLHAAWLERRGKWADVWYRASRDGGKTWSPRLLLSRAAQPTGALTERGFRHFAGHYMSIAEDGRGTAHVVWGARHDDQTLGEIWHARVRAAD
jgi:hypothetical protein